VSTGLKEITTRVKRRDWRNAVRAITIDAPHGRNHAITEADKNIKRNADKGKIYYLEHCQSILQS
jgi:hypothetical protein